MSIADAIQSGLVALGRFGEQSCASYLEYGRSDDVWLNALSETGQRSIEAREAVFMKEFNL
ncbi:MAG: hypothetical protein ACKVGW_16795 [Verrucomicrobiia bacterium]|jgi:hypothetical protein